MSQEEVISLLKKEKKPLACCQIAQKLEQDYSKISKCLKKLLKHKEVKYETLDRNEAKEYLQIYITRKVRIYYIPD